MEIYVLTAKKEGSDLVNVGAFTSREKAIDFAVTKVFELYNYGNEIDEPTRRRVERVFRDEMNRRNQSIINKRVYSIVSTKLM